MKELENIYFRTREECRNRLIKNHDTNPGIWFWSRNLTAAQHSFKCAKLNRILPGHLLCLDEILCKELLEREKLIRK